MGAREGEPKSESLPDRPATSDAEGNRIYIYQAEIKGRFQSLRSKIHAALIVIFLILPWVRIHGRQALLLDIANRRFAIFGITFWAHDAPLLVFLFSTALFSLCLVTALWGRLWCGWGCPQTVFTNSVFRWIERWIEGGYVARRRLDQAPWSAGKAVKKTAKWALFAVATLVVSHSFLAYFTGTEELARMIRQSPALHPMSFGVMCFVTVAMLFDLGWFRDQFCTVLCPYARFQSILMDEHSVQVLYDKARGEPRRGAPSAEGTRRGDCIDCFRCVRACPTGMDIRRGTQLECVGCAACVDACDEVMTRMNKPPGLIRYDSAIDMSGGEAYPIRPRTLAYAGIAAVALIGLVLTIAFRKPVEAAFTRAIDTPYQEIVTRGSEPQILNRFKVAVSNQSFDDLALIFVPHGRSEVSVVTAEKPLMLAAGQRARVDVFVKFPRRLLKTGKLPLRIKVMDNWKQSEGPLLTEEVTLVGPFF